MVKHSAGATIKGWVGISREQIVMMIDYFVRGI